LIDLICISPKVTNKEIFTQKIFEREKSVSTGIGRGIAIPHMRDDSVKDLVIAIGRKKAGIDFKSLDNKPVKLIFMIGGNESQKKDYVSLLSKLTLLLRNKELKNKLLRASTPREMYNIIKS